MVNLRSEKGSITLFVLVSCMFYIASVTCVQMYMQTKRVAVDREYRQVKANYELNTLDEENLKESYYKLANLENAEINVLEKEKTNNKITVKFNLNTDNLDIKTIKYGWGLSEDINTVPSWTYLEKNSINNQITVINENAEEETEYYLFVVVNNKQICTRITFEA